MTDYNDGKWHGWNGGECPVHPETVVDVRYECGMSINKDKAGGSKDVRWMHQGMFPKVVAFRVVKACREPREFFVKVYPDGPKIVHHGAAGAFLVREVRDDA